MTIPMGLKTISSGGHSFPQFPWIRILKQFAAMPHLFHSCQPVLECQTFHSFKFTYIVRYQSQRTGNGLSGNQHVVGTYRRSLGLQACANFCRPFGVGFGDWDHLELQGVDVLQVGCYPFAFVRAEAQLVMYDRRHAKVGWLVGAKALDERPIAF
jgi:hypothetical protein